MLGAGFVKRYDYIKILTLWVVYTCKYLQFGCGQCLGTKYFAGLPKRAPPGRGLGPLPLATRLSFPEGNLSKPSSDPNAGSS